MFLCCIDFPNRIIDAVLEDKLVVFVGAGASMDKPTCLPNFYNLSVKIAEGTGYTLKKKEPCEVFLGVLKSRGIDVNQIAADILSDTCIKHNALHEVIIDLFETPEKVRIVTTNYDQMFEQVMEEKGVKVPVYDIPALPLGNDASGIIHLHGNVNEPKYMIVTDEDFGKAYLTEGYNSRFLVDLFKSYTILFIGYSYNDTIMRYLTRAMFREHSKNRYILTDDTKSDWESLGISPIFYPKRSYAIMREGLRKLGINTKRGLRDWKSIFDEIKSMPPKDQTIETEIDYCLENNERSKVMAESVYGREWMELLDEKGVFASCFNEISESNEKSKIWANWLCEKIICKDDTGFLNLLYKHNSQISRSFANMLFLKIVRDGNVLTNEFFRKYITLFDRYLTNPDIIVMLIELSADRALHHLCLHLFEKLFVFHIKFEKHIWIDKSEPKHFTIANNYHVWHAWELIKEKAASLYPSELLSFVIKTIEDLHYSYEEIGHASKKEEPWSMSMLADGEYDNKHRKDPFHVLVYVFLDTVNGLSDEKRIKAVLTECLKSESVLLRKIAIRAIRENRVLKEKYKIDVLSSEELIWFSEGKEQVYLLAKEVFKNASYEKKKRIIEIIEKGPSNLDERSRSYSVYNWCIWLKRLDPENERIKDIIKDILAVYDFAPREHPELDFFEVESDFVTDESPISKQDMQDIPIEEFVEQLLNYDENASVRYTRQGLLTVFYECVKENTQWAQKIMKCLLEKRVQDPDIWNYLFIGFEEANLSIDESLSLCDELTENMDLFSDVKELSRYLWRLLQRKEIRNRFKDYEQTLFNLSLLLWNKRSMQKIKTTWIIDTVLNTTTGMIILCWIYMVFYSSNTDIPDIYKNKFEETVELKSWEREVAVCILVGHFSFLCTRDRLWCVDRFETMLTGNNKKLFVSSWEGFVYFTRRIDQNTADIMAPIFLKAVKSINLLEKEIRRRFIELYLSLLIYFVEKPTNKYIPELYKYSSEEVRVQFVEAIEYRLGSLDSENIIRWWNRWLKRYFENRKMNKPVELTDLECRALYMLLPKLTPVIEEAINIICKGKQPSGLDFLFWYEIKEEKIAQDHPSYMAKLIIKLLSSNIQLGYESDVIADILKDMHGLSEKEIIQLQEVLLKYSIPFSGNSMSK